MATTTAQGSGSSKNNGGTITNAGNVSATGPVNNSLGLNELYDGTVKYGSQVVANDGTGGSTSDPWGVTKAYSAGTLAYYPTPSERNFLLKGAGDSASKVNNVTNSMLNVVGADYAGVKRYAINKLVTTRKLGAHSDTTLNILARPSTSVVPGRTKGTGAGSAQNYVQVDGSTAASDDAATPTRSVPGELTYMFGSITPKNDTYKAKNSYES
jgi:hypothetical protein